MVAALHRRPPRGAERQHEACRCHKPRKDSRPPRLVGGFTRRVKGLVDAPLCLLLRDAGALRHDLHQIGAALAAQ